LFAARYISRACGNAGSQDDAREQPTRNDIVHQFFLAS
jgi:hypothetical protein